jgi:hypothetical protein
MTTDSMQTQGACIYSQFCTVLTRIQIRKGPHRKGQPDDGLPLGEVEAHHREHERGKGDVQDEEVEQKGDGDRTQQPQVAPGPQDAAAQRETCTSFGLIVRSGNEVFT